jgi:hypothetical protein
MFAPRHSVVGAWQAKSYTLYEKGIAYIKGVRIFESGTVLNIKTDSTFEYKSCGRSVFGKWQVKEDSLVLRSDSSVYSDEKHRKLAANFPQKILLIYDIQNSKLIRYHKGIFSNIEKSTKDGSLKIGNTHEDYSVEILKQAD